MGAVSLSKRQQFWLGFLAGLLAGILATGVMMLLSLVAGGVSLPESLAAAISLAMPLAVFDYLHRTIGGDAKYYLLYIILVGQVLVFALSGGLYNLLLSSQRFTKWRDEQGQIRWLAGLVLALLLWLFAGLIFLPLTGGGIFGSALVIGVFNTVDSLAAVGIVFGLLFVFAQNWLVLRQRYRQGGEDDVEQRENVLRRRSIIQNGLALAGLAVLGAAAWRFITSVGDNGATTAPSSRLLRDYKKKVTPQVPDYGAFSRVDGLSSEITTNEQFYVVSKNIVSDPNVDGKSWQLSVDGLVNTPYKLNYNQLTALPLKKQYESLMCISNEVGGTYMSNALWEGIPLTDLLQRAGGVKKGATKIVLHAADDYTDSIHLSKALEPTTLVAVRMNGAQLPPGHGYPARLLVPGIYGMKHVKWITRIEVVDTDFKGYWQQSGWSDPAPVRMTSRIDTPHSSTSVQADKPTYVAGVAFSGNKGISAVDVSFNGGGSWQSAKLKKPLSDLTWVLWEIPWQPAAGTYTIVVRATDKEGNVQDPQLAPPLPDGSSGYHTITVNAR